MEKDIKNTDPREIGTGGLEGLQWKPNSTENKYSYDYTLDNVPSLKEFLETPSDSPETKRRVSEGYSVGSMDTEGIYAPDLYDSKYDHEVKSINELENLEDFRAEKQPWYEKFGNGLAKMGILAKDTYLQTVGLGFTSMFSDVEGKESIWNNDLAEISYQNMKEMEKKFPNYYTEEEREAYATGKWTTMLDTANFWGDHFLKNLGFTIGAGAGAMFSPQGFAIGALSTIPYLRGAGRFLARALGTMYAAAGESNVEAYHAYKEFKESEFAKNSQAVEMELAKIRNKYSSQLNELSKAKQYALSMLNSNISNTERNKVLTLLSEIDNKERYLTEALEQDYTNYENTLKGIERDIEERALSVGNTTWAANFALLSVTEFFSFGKFFDSGAMQRTIRFANNRAQDASKVGRRIAGQAVYDAVQEGPIEEMGQKFISESAKSAYSADSPDAYYEAYNNEDAKIKIKNWQKGMIEGFHQSYGSEAAWEEGFIGAITGMMPGATSSINGGTSSDDTFLGKNKKVGLRGGLPGLIAEYVSTKNRNKKLVDRVNSLLEEYVDTDGKVKNALAAHLHFSEIMGGLSYTDDTFSFKNARDSSDFSLIQAMSEAGLVKNLDEMLNVDYSTLSDEELSSLAQQMSWEDVTVGNKKQSPIATKEGKEAFLKQLNQNKERMQEAYSNYKESVEFINSNPKLRDLSYDQKTQLAWLHFKERAISNRQKQINDSIRTSLTAIQSHIDDYISTNEASENKTTQERIKDYKKLKEIIENIIAGNSIEIKDKKEWISFLQKGNVQKALSYNNKSFKEGKEFIKGLRDLVLLENLKNEFKSSLDTYLKNPNTLVEETKKKEEKKQKEEEDKKKKEVLNAANSASVSSLTDLDEEEEKTVSQIVGDAIDKDDSFRDAIRMKLEEAKKAKRDLKTLEDIKNAILEGDVFSQDDIDAIESIFEYIGVGYNEALDSNRKKEFEDIESPLWKSIEDGYKQVSGKTHTDSQRQLYQNIIDKFKETQEFKNSLPSNSNTQPNVTTTTGKDGSAEPSLSTKRKSNKKEELRKDSNPFNEEDAEEERKNNQKNGGNKAEESDIRRNPDGFFNYWKTAITEYYLRRVKDKKTREELWIKFTELIDNEKKYTTLEGKELNLKYTKEEIKWIKEVTKYLEDQGCFSYLKNNNLKVGDKVTFFADLKFAEEKGLIVRDKDGNITDIPIFIKKGNQIIGVLPNKTFREINAEQAYLDEWIADFLNELNTKSKNSTEGLISFEKGGTEVAEVLAGHLPYIKTYRRITEAFRQDDINNMSIAIMGSYGDFMLTDNNSNIKIRPYMGDKKSGKPFILMPIQSKEYTHMAVPMAMDTVNPIEGEVSLNGVLYDILNNLSGKKIDLIFRALNNIIFETIRVNFENGGIHIELDDGKNRSTIYEGDPTNVSKIIESFKEANLHFNVLLNGNDARTKNIFNSFSSITRDTNYNKLVLNTAKTNVGTSQENSDVMINSWYTLNPINGKGQQVTASRPEHQTTIAPKQKTTTKANKKDRQTVDNINQKAEKEKNRKKSKTSKKEKNANISQPQVDTVNPGNNNTSSVESTLEKIKTKLEEAGFDMDEIDEEEFFDALEEDIENLWGLLNNTPNYEIINLERLTTKSIKRFIDYLENKGKARVITEGTKETIDVEKEKAWFKKVFPNLDDDRIITTIDNFIRIRGNKYAYGMYKRGMITLSKIGASGTLYHEAFHFVFDLFVSQEEKENIFDEARDKFKLRDYIRKEHEDLEIEEQLAEAFRRYVQFEETPIIGSLVHVFRQLKYFIQSFLGNEAYIDNLFYRINNAKIDTSEVQPSSSVVRLKEEPYTQEMLDIKAKAIVDGTFMKAPNGKPSNLNERQWLHVRTKAFKKWFGDWTKITQNEDGTWNIPDDVSKVIDIETGEPLVVYHGTPVGNFTIFKNGKYQATNGGNFAVGTFTTTDLNSARRYSGDRFEAPKVKSTEEYKKQNFIEKILKNPLKKIPNSDRASEYSPRLNSDANNFDAITNDVQDNNRGMFKSSVYSLFVNIKNPKIVDYNGNYWSSSPEEVIHKYWVRVQNMWTEEKAEYIEVDSLEAARQYIENYKSNFKEFKNFTVPEESRTRDKILSTANYGDSIEDYGGWRKDTGEFISVRIMKRTTPKTVNGLAYTAEQQGYDGLIVFNIQDANMPETGNNYPIDEFIPFNPNQIKSATDNIGTYDESNDDIRYLMAGETGAYELDIESVKNDAAEAMVRLDNLEIAILLEEENKEASEIKRATGWERGLDGQWRYEIDDFQVNIDLLLEKYEEYQKNVKENPESSKEPFTVYVEDILSGENILAYYDFKVAYNTLSNMSLVFENMEEGTRGYVLAKQSVIHLNKSILTMDKESLRKDLNRTIAHETQHLIQDVEGFSPGGNTRIAIKTSKAKREIEAYEKWRETVENTYKVISERYNKESESVKNDSSLSTKERKKRLREIYSKIEKEEVDKSKNAYKEAKEKGGLVIGEDVYRLSDYSYYYHLAGEAEARAVSNRMNLSFMERRESLLKSEVYKEVKKEHIHFIESSIEALDKLENSIEGKNNISAFEENENSSTENKEEQLSAEDKSKLEKQKIRNFRINKLEYSNLSLEDLQYLEERGISKEEYNSMEMLEKEIVMKCR